MLETDYVYSLLVSLFTISGIASLDMSQEPVKSGYVSVLSMIISLPWLDVSLLSHAVWED